MVASCGNSLGLLVCLIAPILFACPPVASADHLVPRRGTNALHHAGRALLAGPNAAPDYTVYHRKDELLKKVEALVASNPGTMSLEVRKNEEAGYKVAMQVVTVEPGGLTDGKHSSKLRLFMDFGEHGRELISSELGLRLMQTLADPAAIRKVLGHALRGERLVHLLHKTVFKILPMENVNGRGMVETGQLCERKNGRGVDTNRNYEVDWGKKEPDYDPKEEYPGTAPYSEPEVQIVKDIATSFKPHVWLNVHSGMEAMFVPWDHQATVPAEASKALAILQEIHRDYFGPDCIVGSGGKSVGYLAHGTATDFMFSVLKVPMPYTWEIYGDFKAAYHDCFKMFNPIGKNATEATLSLWLKAIFRLIELAPTHHAVAADVPILDPSTASHTAGTQGFEAHTTAVTAPYPPSKPASGFSSRPPVPTAHNVSGELAGKRAEERDEVVYIEAARPSSSGLWLSLLLGGGGIVVVAFLVIRYIRSTKAGAHGSSNGGSSA